MQYLESQSSHGKEVVPRSEQAAREIDKMVVGQEVVRTLRLRHLDLAVDRVAVDTFRQG